MIPLIDILIILSGFSAARAGPVRRYINSTLQTSGTASGVPYNPAANSPSDSLPPIDGITTLPFSLLADESTEVPTMSDMASSTSSEISSIATKSAWFTYQPLEPDTSTVKSNIETAPTSFWTFGDQLGRPKKTTTITATMYTTIIPSSHVLQSTDIHTSQPRASAGQPQNSNCTTAQLPSWRTSIRLDPMPTTTSLPTTSILPTSDSQLPSSLGTDKGSSSETSQIVDTSTSATFAYPYPSSDTEALATAAPSVHNNEPTPTSTLPFDAPQELPEVVNEGASATDSQHPMSTANSSMTGVVPGITIVPQNPSVIYITVTEAGATTTVTA